MEYNKQTTERFLNLYRQLETIRDGNPNLYSYYQKKYDSLFEQFRSLRNLLSHEQFGGDYPVAVSSAVASSLSGILAQMGLSAYEVASKSIYALKESDSLSYASSLFAEKGFGYLPILDAKKRVLGVLTPQKLLALRNEDGSFATKTVGSYMDSFALNKQSKRFAYLSRNAPFYQAERLFLSQEGGKRIGLIFLTESGDPDQSLLGLLTVYDVLKSVSKDSEGRCYAI